MLRVPRALSLNALHRIYLRADMNQDGMMSGREVLAALRSLRVLNANVDDDTGLRLVKRVFSAEAEVGETSAGLSFDDFCCAYETLRAEIAQGRGLSLLQVRRAGGTGTICARAASIALTRPPADPRWE